jgi:hypothetical protein
VSDLASYHNQRAALEFRFNRALPVLGRRRKELWRRRFRSRRRFAPVTQTIGVYSTAPGAPAENVLSFAAAAENASL